MKGCDLKFMHHYRYPHDQSLLDLKICGVGLLESYLEPDVLILLVIALVRNLIIISDTQ